MTFSDVMSELFFDLEYGESIDNDVTLLDIGDKVVYSGYIDFIKWEDFNTSICKGLDISIRPFICLKMIINNNLLCQTFFQRYNDNFNLWMGAYAGKPDLLETVGGMRDEEKKFIIDLIKNGEAKITEDLRLNYPASVGDTVYVYCQKKWDAAITLQTHWRKCRYDPTYEMCHKVQLRGLDDILNESKVNNSVNNMAIATCLKCN